MKCPELAPAPTQVVVRRWDRQTEDLTAEGITTDTAERIRAGNKNLMMDNWIYTLILYCTHSASDCAMWEIMYSDLYPGHIAL